MGHGEVEAVAASISGRTAWFGSAGIRIVFNLSSPGMALEGMPQCSVDRCEWRCPAEGLGHQWPARLQFRTRTVKPSVCSECGKRRNRAPTRENCRLI